MERREPRIDFVGEHDGPPERELKALLAAELTHYPAVRRAYLAIVGFGPEAPLSVALCLAPAKAESPVVVDACAQIFRRLFKADMALDMLFVTAEQEGELARVCSAFYPVTP